MTKTPETAATGTDTRRERRPQAVLWDMDGTLVDTEPYWIAEEIALAAEHGGSWSHEQAMELVGWPLTSSARRLRDEAGIAGTPEEIADTLVGRVAARVRRDGPPWRPGARELLTELGHAGVPCALVTMSYAALATAVVDALPPGTFGAVITGDAVTRGKPHPEPYLTAARQLGVDIAGCVAIEDSPPGVDSALASGAVTIAVPLMVDIPQVPGLHRRSSLAGVDLAELSRLVD